MITKEKIIIYKHYNGDIDGWARTATRDQKVIINDKDWLLIQGIVQDLMLVKNGFASESYLNAINEKLQANCDNEETIQELRKIANS